MLSFLTPERKKLKPPRTNIALRILLVTDGLVVFSASMLGPIYALFVRDIGGDILDTGLAAGVFTATAGIVVFLSGRFSDRVRESELVVAAGYAIMGTGFFSYAVVQNVGELLLVQALIGFGQALCSPSFDALYSKHVDPGKSGSQWGGLGIDELFCRGFWSACREHGGKPFWILCSFYRDGLLRVYECDLYLFSPSEGALAATLFV